jgi:uncharacterized membrane protein
MPRTRWFHLSILALLVVVAAGFRWRHIDRFSIWGDEYWALYIATGRGDQLFQIPHQLIITNPPSVGFAGAPRIWHIWTGVGDSSHPPFYHITLRAWIDLFGDSDRSIRSLSAVLGILCIVFLFEAVRLQHGPVPALLAATMMAFAAFQIDYSQQVRPYTLLELLAILILLVVINIEKRGANRSRCATLALLTALIEITHYFSPGIVLGAALYAIIDLRGRDRRRTLGAIAFGSVVAAAAWGPQFFHNRAAMDTILGVHSPTNLLQAMIDLPQRLLLGPVNGFRMLAVAALAILTFVLPAFDRRKRLWWTFLVGYVCWVLAVDLMKHTILMGTDRYIFAVAPAVFSLLALPLPSRLGALVPVVCCLAAITFGIARLQQGPAFTVDSHYQIEDPRMSAIYLKANACPGDLVIFTGGERAPAFAYFVTSHYDGPWKTPILLANDPLDETLKSQLSTFRRIWVSGPNVSQDMQRILPGCSISEYLKLPFDSVCRLVLPR